MKGESQPSEEEGVGRLHTGRRLLICAKAPDIEASLAAATAGGGKVLTGPTEIPGGDRIAEIVDPQGAAFALHECS
jgi:predicted enzyme related to lactoylglutathione lyase